MANDLDARMPPWDDKAERAVLGAMLRENSCILAVMKLIRAASFYKQCHQLMFDCIVEIVVVLGMPADAVTLGNEVYQRDAVADIGGYGYIVEIWEAAPSVANAEDYAQIVRGCAIKRALMRVGHEIEAAAMHPGDDWKAVLDQAEKAIFEISKKVRKAETVHFGARVDEMVDRMDARKTRKEGQLLQTGIKSLDKITGGLDEGNLIVIGARTGIGKTIVSLNLAFNFAEEGHPVLLISLEQPGVELAERVISSRSNIEAYCIRQAIIQESQEKQFFDAIDSVKKTPVWISDTPRQTVIDIVAAIRQMVHKHGVKCVFIDYLQLISSEDRRVQRHEQLAEMTRQLKLAARETGARVFLLAQIGRESEKGVDKRPQIHQLRESGATEQDADVILLLFCEDQTTSEMDVIVGKNRHGLTGVAKVHFDRRRLKIMDRV